jgi:hypothetical protein
MRNKSILRPQNTFIKLFNFIFFYFFLFLQITNLEATLFIPIPISNQIDESDIIIHAVYIDKSFKVLSSTGEIVTKHKFKLVNFIGELQKDYINNEYIEVLSPGGSWQGIKYYVEGVPDFIENEEVILFLKKKSNGYWIQNLKLGKYGINRKKLILISEVFPNDQKLGKIEIMYFEKLVSKKFKKSWKLNINKHVEFTEKNNVKSLKKISEIEELKVNLSQINSFKKMREQKIVSRNLASLEGSFVENKNKFSLFDNEINYIIPLIILILIGLVFFIVF